MSIRSIRGNEVERAIVVTSRLPKAHGAPVWVGNPGALGIADLGTPDWGEADCVEDEEVPVFWACGVTPQAVASQTKPPLMITHASGHLFITDIPIGDLELEF